jgi:drug/metabolite transporter (DMT)-like permease
VPFVAALAARLAGEPERFTPVRIAGMCLGVVGIVALLGLDIEGAQLLSLVAVALVVLGYATAPLIVSRKLPEVPGVAASSVALLVTAVVCTALALALFFALIREVGPQRALVITFVNPAVAVLLGVLLLDEPFTLGIAIGLPLVLVGCVLATRRSPRRTAPSELCDVDAAVP